MKFNEFKDKYLIHIEALIVIILMISIIGIYYKDVQLKKEINKNCGWGEEDYHCFCEKSKVIEMENSLEENYDLVNWVGDYND